MKVDRITFIDALKGFAILCVVMGHICDGYISANIFLDMWKFFWTAFNIIYAFHMPLFFLISGYVFYVAYVRGGGTKE